jgi:hypothetical protein
MMQNAKDTFYEVLRSRLAAINPDRTIVLRGVTRPGLLVQENELETAVALPDCFRMSWTEVSAECHGALPLLTLTCALAYETAGNGFNAGMDRGRALAAMDAELLAAMNQAPWVSAKTNYAALARGGTAVSMRTNIWWGPVHFGKTVVNDDRIGRSATIAVMAYEEAGEM